jgi:hypothetical protein
MFRQKWQSQEPENTKKTNKQTNKQKKNEEQSEFAKQDTLKHKIVKFLYIGARL